MRFLFAVAVIAMLLFAGCVTEKPTTPGNGKNATDCAQIQNSEKRDNCHIDAAIALKNVSICRKVQGSLAKWCYPNVAHALNDSSICDESPSISDKDLCYFRAAITLKNSSICEKIVYDRDSCYVAVEMR